MPKSCLLNAIPHQEEPGPFGEIVDFRSGKEKVQGESGTSYIKKGKKYQTSGNVSKRGRNLLKEIPLAID